MLAVTLSLHHVREEIFGQLIEKSPGLLPMIYVHAFVTDHLADMHKYVCWILPHAIPCFFSCFFFFVNYFIK